MRKGKKSKAITQQNLEESREVILAKGKKFRYPFQYAKHRLVIITVLISVVAIATFGFIGWLQLYKFQNTSDVVYRFTKVLGLSVADVDGVAVRYSDYLMLYRSSIKSVERQQGTLDDSEDSRRLKDYYKRQALSNAEDYSYAMKKLEEMGKPVTDEEVDKVVEEHKTIDGEVRSDEAFAGIIRNNFGLDINEYRRMVRLSLAKRNYSTIIDSEANKIADEISETLKTDKNLASISEKYKGNEIFSFESLSEMVDASNLDSGRASTAFQLKEVGDVSGKVLSKNGDGYYFVKLTDRVDNGVKYDSIQVRFTEFDKMMGKFRDEGKVHEYITIDSNDQSSESSEEK